MSATITLGTILDNNTDEADFDAWASYVVERIDARLGVPSGTITIEQSDATGRHSHEDNRFDRDFAALGLNDSDVREAMIRLWDDFCADTSAWPKRVSA